MRSRPRRIARALLLAGQALPGTRLVAPAEDWLAPAEISGHRATPRYDETLAYLRRLAAAAPKQMRVEVFGKTG